MMGKPENLQIIHFNKVFHYFHHSFWGVNTTWRCKSPHLAIHSGANLQKRIHGSDLMVAVGCWESAIPKPQKKETYIAWEKLREQVFLCITGDSLSFSPVDSRKCEPTNESWNDETIMAAREGVTRWFSLRSSFGFIDLIVTWSAEICRNSPTVSGT